MIRVHVEAAVLKWLNAWKCLFFNSKTAPSLLPSILSPFRECGANSSIAKAVMAVGEHFLPRRWLYDAVTLWQSALRLF